MNLSSLDTALFLFINKTLHLKTLDPVMVFVTVKPYLIALPFVLAIFVKDRKAALPMFAVSLAAFAMSDWAGFALKELFARPRPCAALEGVSLLVGCGGSFSMPSNHAADSFAFAVPFYLMTKSRLRYALLAEAALVALSRPYVGVHYPSDIAVGALLGSAVAVCTVKVYRWAEGRAVDKPAATWLWVFLAALSLFRIYYILNGPLDLSADEAHYWEWSRRLDIGYYSKGPLIAYLIALGTSVFGNNAFGVRALAVVLSVLSSIFMFRLGRDLYDEKVGALSAIVLQIVPIFNAQAVLMTTDAPFVFFWILSLYLIHKALTSGHPAYWLLLGLSAGAGLLAKYTMAFFFLSALLYILVSKERRGWLARPWPYAGAALAVAVFSPVIIWNLAHGMVALKHTAGHLNVSGGLSISPRWLLNFLGSQLGVVTPLLLVMVVIALVKLRKTSQGAFLFWFSAPVLAFFTLKSLQGKVQANWPAAGYLAGLTAFCAYYLRDSSSAPRARRATVAAALAISVLVTAVSYYPSLVNLPPRLDPTKKVKGWAPLGEEVSRIRKGLGGPSFVFSDSYQVSSELAFYVEGHPVTYCINLGRRMNQYDLWPGPEGLAHYNAVFVKINDSEIPEEVGEAFKSCDKRLFIVLDKAGRPLRTYSIFTCRDFGGNMRQRTPERF
jgi:membrane-associated phospholipid phosphatase